MKNRKKKKKKKEERKKERKKNNNNNNNNNNNKIKRYDDGSLVRFPQLYPFRSFDHFGTPLAIVSIARIGGDQKLYESTMHFAIYSAEFYNNNNNNNNNNNLSRSFVSKQNSLILETKAITAGDCPV